MYDKIYTILKNKSTGKYAIFQSNNLLPIYETESKKELKNYLNNLGKKRIEKKSPTSVERHIERQCATWEKRHE
jgi:hypothetical protein